MDPAESQRKRKRNAVRIFGLTQDWQESSPAGDNFTNIYDASYIGIFVNQFHKAYDALYGIGHVGLLYRNNLQLS